MKTKKLLVLLISMAIVVLSGCSDDLKEKKESSEKAETIAQSEELNLYTDMMNYELSEFYTYLERFKDIHESLAEGKTSLGDPKVEDELWGIAQLYNVKVSTLPTIPVPNEAQKTHDQILNHFSKQEAFFNEYIELLNKAMETKDATDIVKHVKKWDENIDALKKFAKDEGFTISVDTQAIQSETATEEPVEEPLQESEENANQVN